MSEIETLLARIERLETQLLELRNTKYASMRDTRTCPACGNRSILYIHRRLDSSLALRSSREIAPLEAYACRKCSFVEWSARDLETLWPDGHDVEELEPEPNATPTGSPYR